MPQAAACPGPSPFPVPLLLHPALTRLSLLLDRHTTTGMRCRASCATRWRTVTDCTGWKRTHCTLTKPLAVLPGQLQDFSITSKLGPLLGIFWFTNESKSITLLEKTHQITLLSPHTHSVFSWSSFGYCSFSSQAGLPAAPNPTHKHSCPFTA